MNLFVSSWMCTIIINNHDFILYIVYQVLYSIKPSKLQGLQINQWLDYQENVTLHWAFLNFVSFNTFALFSPFFIKWPAPYSGTFWILSVFFSDFNFFTSLEQSILYVPAAEHPRLLNLCRSFDSVFGGHFLCPLVHMQPYFQQLVPSGCFHEDKIYNERGGKKLIR